MSRTEPEPPADTTARPLDQADAPRSPSNAPTSTESELFEQLRALQEHESSATLETTVLDNLYLRTVAVLAAQIPGLAEIPLPIPHKRRLTIRRMQDMSAALAELLLGYVARNSLPDAEISRWLWRALHLLSRHLLISSLTAAPSSPGLWRRLHGTYLLADRCGITQNVPEETERSLQDVYYAAALLGCAQPTSFTSREILFLDDYLERFSAHIEIKSELSTQIQETFWINSDSDAPATPYSRKPAPPETPVVSFSCTRLALLLDTQLAALETGTPPTQLDLPAFAASVAGQGVLNRLVNLWGNPGKRRFPRRRQNFRCQVCLGFDNLIRLYGKTRRASETSAWMITNESPDGYTVMHLSGPTQAISVGDVAALRADGGSGWQLCIIRWILSENQEHLELGLQILSSQAYAASIVLPDAGGNGVRRQPVLVLPPTPALRPNEALVVPSGTLGRYSRKLLLVIERDNIEVREIITAGRDERNGLIELYGIATDWDSVETAEFVPGDNHERPKQDDSP